MNLILPPKRFEDPWEPRFDPIRFRPWFRHLEERRKKLPSLKFALSLMPALSQVAAAQEAAVDERELRDYFWFMIGAGSIQNENRIRNQAILDEAYRLYDFNGGAFHIRKYIHVLSPRYGVNPRHVEEAWEVDPTFYPINYVYQKSAQIPAQVHRKDGG